MDLKKILSIPGKPGLYKMVGQTKNGAIVESFIDKKRFPAFASETISTLNDIVIYTSDKDVPLKEVLKKIFDKQSGGAAIDSKSDEKTLRTYFEEVLPEYDKERVYTSDIKKIIGWYNLLHEHGVLEFEEEEKKEEPEKAEETTVSAETGEEEK